MIFIIILFMWEMKYEKLRKHIHKLYVLGRK